MQNSLDHLIYISVLALILTLHSFFVLAALALKKSRSNKLREIARKEQCKSARYARIIRIRSNRYLLSAQMGVFLSALLLGFALLGLVRGASASLAASYAWATGWVGFSILSASLFLVVSLVSLIIVQLVKSVGFAYPERALCLVSIPLLVTYRLLSPFVTLLNLCTSLILWPFGIKRASARETVVSPEQISEMIELSSDAGQIEEDEREMIQRVFTFSNTLVREVMTPRADMVWVYETASLEDVQKIFACERLSRLVVVGKDPDDVKGVLHAKDLINFMGKTAQDFDVRKIMRKPYFVPGTKTTGDLLPELREQGVHLALVQDEHGGVDGIITVEDLVEEIVGEIRDEYDSPAEESDVTKTNSGELIVDGSALVEDLNQRYKLDIPLGEYDTLAGFVIQKLGRIPEANEVMNIGGVWMRVEELEQNRIVQVRIKRNRKGFPAKELDPKPIKSLKISREGPASENLPNQRNRIQSLG